MPSDTVTRLSNSSPHMKHINLGGGELAIAIPPAETIELKFESEAERARFKRAIATKGIRRWLDAGELVVVEAVPEPPPPPPALMQITVTKRRKRYDPTVDE
jgi:hypothetical protein